MESQDLPQPQRDASNLETRTDLLKPISFTEGSVGATVLTELNGRERSPERMETLFNQPLSSLRKSLVKLEKNSPKEGLTILAKSVRMLEAQRITTIGDLINSPETNIPPNAQPAIEAMRRVMESEILLLPHAQLIGAVYTEPPLIFRKKDTGLPDEEATRYVVDKERQMVATVIESLSKMQPLTHRRLLILAYGLDRGFLRKDNELREFEDMPKTNIDVTRQRALRKLIGEVSLRPFRTGDIPASILPYLNTDSETLAKQDREAIFKMQRRAEEMIMGYQTAWRTLLEAGQKGTIGEYIYRAVYGDGAIQEDKLEELASIFEHFSPPTPEMRTALIEYAEKIGIPLSPIGLITYTKNIFPAADQLLTRQPGRTKALGMYYRNIGTNGLWLVQSRSASETTYQEYANYSSEKQTEDAKAIQEEKILRDHGHDFSVTPHYPSLPEPAPISATPDEIAELIEGIEHEGLHVSYRLINPARVSRPSTEKENTILSEALALRSTLFRYDDPQEGLRVVRNMLCRRKSEPDPKNPTRETRPYFYPEDPQASYTQEESRSVISHGQQEIIDRVLGIIGQSRESSYQQELTWRATGIGSITEFLEPSEEITEYAKTMATFAKASLFRLYKLSLS